MRYQLLLTISSFLFTISSAQSPAVALQKAFDMFENDVQLKHAISSLYVIDAKTGEVVFDKNSQVGLAPASTQKIITSVTAFELLGKDYRYKTSFGYDGNIIGRRLDGRIFVIPSGDPTLGSWRYESTKEAQLMGRLLKSIKSLKVDTVAYLGVVEASRFETGNIPDGWIWQDVGNYYGAGPAPLNWRENQYDMLLKSGNMIGDDVDIADIDPYFYSEYGFDVKLKAAAKGSGDNAYIYLPVGLSPGVVKGTIPVGQPGFRISGAIADPIHEFRMRLQDTAKKAGIVSLYDVRSMHNGGREFQPIEEKKANIFHVEYSPSLDSIIYWFNKKSINLYGESLVRTLAYEKQGLASTDSGVAVLKRFWKQNGLDEDELNMYDGSGLSPLNRVTTHAQVEILKYAKTKAWFPYFYNALPDYNGMRIKSGTISDVKGFCGYHKAKDGREYIFSFLVNNYTGKAAALVGKMYKVLDTLK